MNSESVVEAHRPRSAGAYASQPVRSPRVPQNRNSNARRSRRGLVIVVTAPPRPQFAGEELTHADFGRNGEASFPSATASVTAALLFRTLKTWAYGSITNLSRNVNTFFKPRSN